MRRACLLSPKVSEVDFCARPLFASWALCAPTLFLVAVVSPVPRSRLNGTLIRVTPGSSCTPPTGIPRGRQSLTRRRNGCSCGAQDSAACSYSVQTVATLGARGRMISHPPTRVPARLGALLRRYVSAAQRRNLPMRYRIGYRSCFPPP